MELKGFYTVKEIAERAGLHRQQVHRIIQASDVRVERAGRAVFVPLSELRAKCPVMWESLVEASRASKDADEPAEHRCPHCRRTFLE